MRSHWKFSLVVSLLKILDCQDILACRSDLQAGALDQTHTALLGERTPASDN